MSRIFTANRVNPERSQKYYDGDALHHHILSHNNVYIHTHTHIYIYNIYIYIYIYTYIYIYIGSSKTMRMTTISVVVTSGDVSRESHRMSGLVAKGEIRNVL